MIRSTLAVGVVVLGACGPSKPVLPAADALWGSGEVFCARVSCRPRLAED